MTDDRYELGENRYGKSRIRLVTVRRGPDQHHLRDLTVAVALEGEFEAAHTHGDNAGVIATDTMKNTVYAFAKDRLTGSPEAFALELARHFIGYDVCGRAFIDIVEHPWNRVATADGEARDAFVRSGELSRLASVSIDRTGAAEVIAGLDDLTVLKTTKSAFSGFDRDAYTTLPEADDRLMATKVRATWGYGPGAIGDVARDDGGHGTFDFDAAWNRATESLLHSFAEHFSRSVQESIWIMGREMMDAEPAIDWVRMVLPNLHHWKVDLSPFGLDNPGEVFVSTTEPHGLIDATVRRRDG
ncbi:MAG TPA: urate oxidase [Candidatus Limnocylindrales bacterium]|nr:urate oxidase [Candidatus Limnocylindrales bacterium]